jgi:hypothetical protein
VAGNLAADIDWNIYENNLELIGKEAVLEFCNKVAGYFESVTKNLNCMACLKKTINFNLWEGSVYKRR